MRKFLALLLLFWMPLQASLAALEEVHGHHDHATAISSHEHGDVLMSAELTDYAAVPDADCAQDCSTSHLCNAQLLFLDHALATQGVTPSATIFSETCSICTDRASVRPERPQWFTSSH